MSERETRWYEAEELLGEKVEPSPRLPWARPKADEIIINGETLPRVQTHVGGFSDEELSAALSRRNRG